MQTKIADFRSDTVTRPSPAMREAMASAEVGDDVLGHDPTTFALEQTVAALLGKEAALFMPSGSMCNLVSIMTHCRPGQELVLEEWAHMCRFEAGSAGALAHVIVRTLPSDRGVLDPDRVASWVSEGNEHTPPTGLVAVEQTHNFHGGVVQPIEALRAIRDICTERGVPVHMDGARLWNASAATGIAESEYAACADTVSVCLSKGLGAPVGSVLAGPAEFIRQARFARKRVGGGMRQSGVLAAAALVALRDARAGLADDHRRAQEIANRLAPSETYSVDAERVDTNIVFVGIDGPSPASIVEAAAAENILLYATGPAQIRFVTHHDVDDDDVERLLALLARFDRAND